MNYEIVLIVNCFQYLNLAIDIPDVSYRQVVIRLSPIGRLTLSLGRATHITFESAN